MAVNEQPVQQHADNPDLSESLPLPNLTSAPAHNPASMPATMRSSLFLNRELSLLEFNAQVLNEALDERNPLLERIRFLSHFNANLEDFIMIRMAGIREQVVAGIRELSLDGMTPGEEMAALRMRLLTLLQAQSLFFRDTLCPALASQGIKIADYEELTPEQQKTGRDYFVRMVFPVCTPLAVDTGHPFPHISNLSLNLAVELQDPDGQTRFARVKVPNVLPRLIALPVGERKTGQSGRAGGEVYVWLEQLLAANLDALFPQMRLLEVHPFRVVRDADLDIQEFDAADLLETVEQSLSQRRFGSTVALFMNPTMPRRLYTLLAENLELEDSDIYEIEGPLGLSNLMELYRVDRPDLKDPQIVPRVPQALRNNGSIFDAIQQGDILLHHPFDSFNPVIDLITSAAADRDVLAIKQTLYRVGNHSPIVEALLEAAEAGKQVAVLVEVKARGDEENNIEWARALEQAGVHVTYGLMGLKTHCKVALVVRKEGGGIRRYVHLGTGNYNPVTARLYTDMGLLTCRPDFGADASELFNYLTGYSKQTQYRKLIVAPIALRTALIALIDRESRRQREHGDGKIIFKVNHMVDPGIIEALYSASHAGVKIDLIVRSMCSLRPGVPKLSETINVVRIVGRFLEHSRIFYFHNGGKQEILMGSADMMQRNLDHRVEVLFPVEDAGLRSYISRDVLEAYLRDNIKASVLQSDGSYVRKSPGSDTPFDVQGSLASMAAIENNDAGNWSALPKKLRKHLRNYGRDNRKK